MCCLCCSTRQSHSLSQDQAFCQFLTQDLVVEPKSSLAYKLFILKFFISGTHYLSISLNNDYSHIMKIFRSKFIPFHPLVYTALWYMCAYVCMFMHVCKFLHICSCALLHKCTCVYVHVWCTCVYVHVCMCVYTCTLF